MGTKTKALVVGMGLLGIQACTAGSVEQEALEVGDVDQALSCDYDNAGVMPALAVLATAMAKEIKELHPVRDLRIDAGAYVPNGGIFTLKNVHANKCLDVENGSSSNGANVRLWDCNGATAQQFKFEDMGNGYFQMRNVASNKCVDVWNFSTADGGNIAQYTCSNGGDQQKFSVTYMGNSVVSVISKLSGKALNGWNSGTTNGTNITQFAATGAANQQFVMSRTNGATVGAGVYRVRLSGEGKARCNANGGCKHTDAMLDLQEDALNSSVPQTVFNVTNYRNTLIASYQRQWDWEHNLEMNDPGSIPEPHTLVYQYTTNNGACGPHDVFDALKQNCSGSNCQMTDPNSINNRLQFFENGGNPYLAFYATASQIGIDPTATLSGTSSTSSGSCTSASMVYDPTYSKNNQCCVVDGQYGTFKPSYFNPAIFLCTF